MQREICLNYVIENYKPENESWKYFVNLLSRDYGELIYKHLNNNLVEISKNLPIVNNVPTNSSNLSTNNLTTDKIQEFSTLISETSKRKRSTKSNSEQNPLNCDIVEEEYRKFREQLNDLKKQPTQKRPKRQVKLMANNNKNNSVFFI